MTPAGRLVLVALALAGWPLASAPAAVTEPELVAPDPAAAMGVPIRGATDAERAAAFAGIAAVPDAGVRAVVFFDQGTRRALRVVAPPRSEDRERSGWLASLVTQAIARPLEDGSRPIRWIEVGPTGGGTATFGDDRPAQTSQEIAAVARDLASRAASAGWEVVELRAWPGGPPAIAITLRLTERGLLDGRADWATVLAETAPTRTYERLLRVEAPDGTLLSVAGTLGANGGFGRSEPYGEPRDAPPPAGLAGPTRVELEVEDPPYGNGPERRFRFVLDCDGGPSTGIPDVPALCARLVANRYALLPPIGSDALCSGLVGAPSVALAGTFLGIAVERSFSSCAYGTAERWIELLRVPPAETSMAVGDDYSARRIPLTGGTRAERRAARTTLRGVGEGVVGRVVFARRHGRRVVDVTPHPSAAVTGLGAADAAWVADLVRREIGRRLHGQDAATFERYRYRRLVSRAGTLLSRATRAGFYVRSVQGWNLGPGGAFIVTLRLTERELLDGRTGWREAIAPDRDRERYGVRFDVEAPDGTLVAGGGETLPLGHAPPPPGIDGPTRLRIDADGLPAEHRTLVLDCDGGAGTGVGDPAAACARLVADRYALLAPLQDPSCAAAGFVEVVTVAGTFRGVPIARRYGACSWRIKDRWLRLLDLP